jgi:hypothetical protein
MSRLPDTLFIGGADAAIVGFINRCGEDPIVVYDYDRLVTVFMKQGMTDDEAEEWISVNVEGAWVGKGTPGVLHKGRRKLIEEYLGCD